MLLFGASGHGQNGPGQPLTTVWTPCKYGMDYSRLFPPDVKMIEAQKGMAELRPQGAYWGVLGRLEWLCWEVVFGARLGSLAPLYG